MNLARQDWPLEPGELGLRQLRADPQYSRIESGRRKALVEAALEDGRFLAADARANLGADPVLIAAGCGIPIVESDAEAGFGTTVVFAEYATRPPAITLYMPAIRRLDRSIAAMDLDGRLGLRETRLIFLAHELYHHFDCTRSMPLARRHRVDIFRIGSWRWTSGLASLAEIAAGAFVQELLGLDFHPALLDRYIIDVEDDHRGTVDAENNRSNHNRNDRAYRPAVT